MSVVLRDADGLGVFRGGWRIGFVGFHAPRAAAAAGAAGAVGRLSRGDFALGLLRPVVEPRIGNQVSFILKHVEEIDGTCVGKDTWDGGQTVGYHRAISRYLWGRFHSLTRQSWYCRAAALSRLPVSLRGSLLSLDLLL
jgi:hypothetical protein